jgi:hypothetical protein
MQMHEVADIVTLIGLPLALVGIGVAIAGLIFAGREGRNSRDLEASLSISEAFVGKWFIDWRNLIRESMKVRAGIPIDEDALADGYKSFAHWLNAVGLMVDSRLLARPERVLASMAPTITQMLEITKPMVAAWEGQDGLQHWRGVHIKNTQWHHSNS